MIRLRVYKPCDAKSIVSWCDNETVFNFWGGLHFGKYPITSEIINDKYFNKNGDCAEEDNFYPVTAFDDTGAVGHFIMRYLRGDNKILRFGWVIVDSAKRGRQYGKKMIRLGLKYAFEIMGVQKVTIGVIENNISAYKCYLSAGFRKSMDLQDSYVEINGDTYKIVELEITKEEYYAGKDNE